jgi:hypothetical protein
VQEAKEAEKQVMDKYLALFKQHTTADERMVCIAVSIRPSVSLFHCIACVVSLSRK